MARIKKAQQGRSCSWSRGEKAYRKPLGEKVRDAMWDMKLRRDERRDKRSTRQSEKEAAKKVGPPNAGGYERDFPSDASPGGFKGDPGKVRGSRWADDRETKMVGGMKRGGKIKKKPASSKLVPKKKLGGKLAKQAATAIAMKKKGIKPKKSK